MYELKNKKELVVRQALYHMYGVGYIKNLCRKTADIASAVF